MLVGLVCALGEAQLMPIYHRIRGESSGRRSRRRGALGPVPGADLPEPAGFPGVQALAGRPATFEKPLEAELRDFSYRYEVKYLVEAHRVPEIEVALGGLLTPDPHAEEAGGTYNHSIYFDSPAYRAHTEAQADERVTVRPRIRAYRPDLRRPATGLYLELKRRYDRVIAKRRTPIDVDLADRLLTDSSSEIGASTSISSTLAEYQYLAQRFELRPSVSVLYHRSAFFAAPGRDIRVTFDRLVQCCLSTSLEAPIEGFSCALPPDQVVVEVKYGEDAPGDLFDRLWNLGLRQQSFSKYACALEACAREPDNVTGVE